MASDATLALRERQATEIVERSIQAATEDHRPVTVIKRRAVVANVNALHYCDACHNVFDETEAIKGPSGWTICPKCEQETLA